MRAELLINSTSAYVPSTDPPHRNFDKPHAETNDNCVAPAQPHEIQHFVCVQIHALYK
jgi:hypothetical protein